MLKMIALFRYKPGLAREDAIHYHQTRHVPLICKLLPDICLDHRRSYRSRAPRFPDHMEGATPPPPSFDVMTELWIKGRAEYEELAGLSATASPKRIDPPRFRHVMHGSRKHSAIAALEATK